MIGSPLGPGGPRIPGLPIYIRKQAFVHLAMWIAWQSVTNVIPGLPLFPRSPFSPLISTPGLPCKTYDMQCSCLQSIKLCSIPFLPWNQANLLARVDPFHFWYSYMFLMMGQSYWSSSKNVRQHLTNKMYINQFISYIKRRITSAGYAGTTRKAHRSRGTWLSLETTQQFTILADQLWNVTSTRRRRRRFNQHLLNTFALFFLYKLLDFYYKSLIHYDMLN